MASDYPILYDANTKYFCSGNFCRIALLENMKHLPLNQRDWMQKWNLGYRIAFLCAYKSKPEPHSPKCVNANEYSQVFKIAYCLHYKPVCSVLLAKREEAVNSKEIQNLTDRK